MRTMREDEHRLGARDPRVQNREADIVVVIREDEMPVSPRDDKESNDDEE